jgi:hypothetical protein
MSIFLVGVHNLLRWLILISLLASLYLALTGWLRRKPFSGRTRKTWLFTLIFAHCTLLLGLFQVLFGRFGILSSKLPEGINVMKDRFYRFYWIEHPLSMILAIILITLAYRVAKKPIPDEKKFRIAFWYFLIALLVILAAIPWPFREGIGRPFIPGFS